MSLKKFTRPFLLLACLTPPTFSADSTPFIYNVNLKLSDDIYKNNIQYDSSHFSNGFTDFSCGFAWNINFPGLDELIARDTEKNCSLPKAVEKATSSEKDNTKFDVGKYCEQFDEMIPRCQIPTMDPSEVLSKLQENLKKPKIRNIEIENKSITLERHAKTLQSISSLQMGISTDLKAVEHLQKHLYDLGKNDKSKRDNISKLFNLNEDFFYGNQPSDSKVSLQGFISKVFQCLPNQNSNLEKTIPKCQNLGDSDAENRLKEAKKKFKSNCEKNFLKKDFCDLYEPKNEDVISEILARSILGNKSDYKANPSILGDEQRGMEELKYAHGMLGHISRENFSDELQDEISKAQKEGWNPVDDAPSQLTERLEVKSFEWSRDQVLKDQKNQKLRDEIENAVNCMSIDGRLPDGDYSMGGIETNHKSCFENFSLNKDEKQELIGSLMMIKIGQDYPKNLIAREQRKAKVARRFLGNDASRRNILGNNQRLFDINTRLNLLRYDLLKQESSEQRLSTLRQGLKEVFGGDFKSDGLWKDAIKFEASLQRHRDPALAYLLGLESLISKMDRIRNDFKNQSDLNPSDVLEAVKLETLSELALDSAIKCNQMKTPEEKQAMFCAPLKDSENAKKHLVVLIEENFKKREGNPNFDIDEILRKDAQLYCPSINIEQMNDSLQKNGFIASQDKHPLSMRVAKENHERCQKIMKTQFCDKGNCNFDSSSSRQLQINLFGRTCDEVLQEATQITGLKDNQTPFKKINNYEATKAKGEDSLSDLAKGIAQSSQDYKYNPTPINKNSIGSNSPPEAPAPRTGSSNLGSGTGTRVGNKIRPQSASVGTPLPQSNSQGNNKVLAPEGLTGGEQQEKETRTVSTSPSSSSSSSSPKNDEIQDKINGLEDKISSLEKKRADESTQKEINSLKEEIKKLRAELENRRQQTNESAKVASTVPARSFLPQVRPAQPFSSTGPRGRFPASLGGTSTPTQSSASTAEPSKDSSDFRGRSPALRPGINNSSRLNYFGGESVDLSSTDLSGVSRSSLRKIVSKDELSHKDVLRFITREVEGQTPGENTQYIVIPSDGEILVYTPRILNGEVDVNVAEYNKKEGTIDLNDIETIQFLLPENPGVLSRAPASEPPPIVYREGDLNCVLEGDCLKEFKLPSVSTSD